MVNWKDIRHWIHQGENSSYHSKKQNGYCITCDIILCHCVSTSIVISHCQYMKYETVYKDMK